MRVHRGKCVVSTLRASFWPLKNFTFFKILILASSTSLGGLGAPKMSLGLFHTFPKLRRQNGARRNGTTHLPRVLRFQNTLILIRKHLRYVCTVANALHPLSEHHFVFKRSYNFSNPDLGRPGGPGAPKMSLDIWWHFSKIFQNFKIRMALGDSIQHICHGAYAFWVDYYQ